MVLFAAPERSRHSAGRITKLYMLCHMKKALRPVGRRAQVEDRGFEPLTAIPEGPIRHELAANEPETLAQSLAREKELPEPVRRVLSIWKDLPEPARQALLSAAQLALAILEPGLSAASLRSNSKRTMRISKEAP